MKKLELVEGEVDPKNFYLVVFKLVMIHLDAEIFSEDYSTYHEAQEAAKGLKDLAMKLDSYAAIEIRREILQVRRK